MKKYSPLLNSTCHGLSLSLILLCTSCSSNLEKTTSSTTNISSQPIADTNLQKTTAAPNDDTTSDISALVPISTVPRTDKPLKYHWHPSNNYTQEHLDSVYLLAQQYIKHSSNKLLIWAREANDQLEYSIEQRTQNSTTYDVLGIGHTFEHRFSIMQWIYVDAEQQQIWEYDLPNDTLVLFYHK